MGERENRRLTVLGIVGLVEFVCLLIALAMPITPSKTGGDFSFADLFFDDPGYLLEVLVYFLLSNLIVGILALMALLVIRMEKR